MTTAATTTAVIGTGGIGSAIARLLASGGATLRLASADSAAARTLAAQIGPAAVVAFDNRDALQGADAVVLALRFGVLKDVIDEIAGPLAGKLVVVPSNPVGLDAQGNCRKDSTPARSWPGGCRPGRAWRWRSEPCRPVCSSHRATGHRSRRCSST
jgi:8-hydroxy-5-deazaflavin:NADPH oxidoreductase